MPDQVSGQLRIRLSHSEAIVIRINFKKDSIEYLFSGVTQKIADSWHPLGELPPSVAERLLNAPWAIMRIGEFWKRFQ